jgi:hypothetical protein
VRFFDCNDNDTFDLKISTQRLHTCNSCGEIEETFSFLIKSISASDDVAGNVEVEKDPPAHHTTP